MGTVRAQDHVLRSLRPVERFIGERCSEKTEEAVYTPFELQISARFDDALAILADTCVEPATVLAGGTNVIVDLRAKRIHPKRIVSIDRLQELRGISIEGSRIIVGSSHSLWR